MTLYIGADDGVYSSTNLGANWSRFGTGFPNAQVYQIDFNNNHELEMTDDYGNPYKAKCGKLSLRANIQQGNFWHRGEGGERYVPPSLVRLRTNPTREAP